MASRRHLERRLSALDGFAEPRLDLEQYPTPAGVASHVLHLADMEGDLDGTVIDLGSGTGILALGAALRGSGRVVGIERDPAALRIAWENERRIAPDGSVNWLRGDATRAPVCPDEAGDPVTVVMNPPFGARNTNVHADRDFLEVTARIASVSYSIHNEGSRGFVESFADDNGGTITHAFEATLELHRQFDFHETDRAELDAEVFRIEWRDR